MVSFLERNSILRTILVAMLLACSIPLPPPSSTAATSYSIELEDFRWNTFPLKVLVDMNQWSIPEYAAAVHEALDVWEKSVWNFTRSFTNSTLVVPYVFYVSDVNFTNNYDVLITFAPTEFAIGVKTVGLTSFRWHVTTHTPIPPITINITTYSATANRLSIKNIALHEFGHALGLGHSPCSSTSNGPELMYYTSSTDQVVYPSTLDAYGLTVLYDGNFGQTVHLPPSIPYKMLAGNDDFSLPLQASPLHLLYPLTSEFIQLLVYPQNILYRPNILLVPITLWLVIALLLGLALRSWKLSILLTLSTSVVIAYSITTWDTTLVSLSLKIVPVFPAIVTGASIGGFIGRRFTSDKETRAEELPIEV
jgi:predicted Zn-dependent protease